MSRLVWLILLFCHPAFAGEGFFDKDSAPPKIKDAWDSVFAVITRTDDPTAIGTGFVVDVKVSGSTKEVYILTNRHVAIRQAVKWTSLGVAQNVFARDGAAGLFIDLVFGITSGKARVVRSSKNPDLALLAITVPLNAPVPKILEFAKDCGLSAGANLYSIGFSDTTLRAKPAASNAETITKRWSHGEFIQYSIEPHQGPIYYTDTTVDLILGGSGGALLNEAGQVVGVMAADFSSREKGYAYTNNGAHSSAIRCEEVLSFLHGTRSQFEHEIWLDQPN